MAVLWIVNLHQSLMRSTVQVIVEAPDASAALNIAAAVDQRFEIDGPHESVHVGQFGTVDRSSNNSPLIVKPILGIGNLW